jgi:hypothetical protein
MTDKVLELRKNVDQDKLAEYLQKRDELLQSNPELQELQDVIDETLAHAGSENNRLVLTRQLMLDSLNLLRSKLEELGSKVKELH